MAGTMVMGNKNPTTDGERMLKQLSQLMRRMARNNGKQRRHTGMDGTVNFNTMVAGDSSTLVLARGGADDSTLKMGDTLRQEVRESEASFMSYFASGDTLKKPPTEELFSTLKKMDLDIAPDGTLPKKAPKLAPAPPPAEGSTSRMKELREQLINLEVQFQSDYEDLRAAYEKTRADLVRQMKEAGRQ